MNEFNVCDFEDLFNNPMIDICHIDDIINPTLLKAFFGSNSQEYVEEVESKVEEAEHKEDDSKEDDSVCKNMIYKGKNGNKRFVYTKEAKQIIKSWILRNKQHPYPSKELKQDWCQQFSVPMKSLNIYLTNNRKRLLHSNYI